MVAEVANQNVRRHKISTGLKDQHVTIRFQHNTADQDMFLQEVGLGVQLWEKR